VGDVEQEAADLIEKAKAQPGTPTVFVDRIRSRSERFEKVLREALKGSGQPYTIRTGDTADGSRFVELTWRARAGESA
jgi:hypothetical protein